MVAIVDDDLLEAAAIARELVSSSIVAETVATGSAAVERFGRPDLDAAIVAAQLPDMSAVAFISTVREAGSWAPIIVVTADSNVQEQIRALDGGADDCMSKPLIIAELAARLRALARRAAAPRWAPLTCGGIILEADARHALVHGIPVQLSPRELTLLALLMRRRGQLVQRDEILAEVFGHQFNPGTNVMDVHVAHLRRKLERGDVAIETIRGVGYRLVVKPD